MKLINLIGLILLSAATVLEARVWTDTQGRKLEAEFGGMKDANNVILNLASGQQAIFPVEKLSQADRDWLKSQAPGQTPVPTSPSTSPMSDEKPIPENDPVQALPRKMEVDYTKIPAPKPHIPASQRVWPVEVIVSTSSVNPSERKEDGLHKYRLGRFVFETRSELSVPVIAEIARTFVAIEELVERLPWDLHPTPANGDYFIARLYETRAEYDSIAPPNSGGFYSLIEKVFHVPFDSLGITDGGKKGWVKSAHFSSDTLIHELTHMMMDPMISGAPLWLAEGSAEYVETIPFSQSGVLRPGDLGKALPEYVKTMSEIKLGRGKFAITPTLTYTPKPSAETMLMVMRMSHQAWHNFIKDAAPYTPPPNLIVSDNPELIARQKDLYMNACLLFYYFLHLDNPRERGQPMLALLDRLQDNVPHWQMYDAAYRRFRGEAKVYLAAWEEFKKQPGVEDLGNGRIRYPQDLKPPQAPTEPPAPYPLDKVADKDRGLLHLDILTRGRSDDELKTAFREGFKRIGIDLE